jgi:uncharacterized protein YwqG
MADNTSELSVLNVEELLDEYVRHTQLLTATQHWGREKRISKQQQRIVEALKSRTDGTTRLLLPLREHPDPFVQHAATILCKSLDPDGYSRIMQTLAKDRGPIGKRAKDSLALDEWYKEHPPTPRQPLPPQPPSFARRSASEVPTGIARAELEERVRAEFPGDLARRVLALARPTIGVWPRQWRENSDPRASRLGGVPLIPEKWVWPSLDGEPMLFVGQINCAELGTLSSADVFPRSGLIAFFGDNDFLHGCTGGLETEGAAVFHWPETETLIPASDPIEDFEQLPKCGLAFYETHSLPDMRSREIEQLPFDRDQRERYRNLHEAVRAYGVTGRRLGDIRTSKLLGWPDMVQNDFMPGPGGEHRERLLFQVGGYGDGTDSHDWGPGGLVYFAISEKNLAARCFDRVLFEMQCS